MSNPPAHIKGSQQDHSLSWSHGANPAHPGTSREPIECLCNRQRCTGHAAMHRGYSSNSQASAPTAFLQTRVSKAPGLDMFKTRFSFPPAQDSKEGTIQTPQHSLDGLLHPSKPSFGLLTGTFLPPSLHWQGHSAVV